MKKINIIYSVLALALVLLTGSCRKEPNVGGTAVQSLSGEWWVTTDDGTGPSGYYKLSTFNTAANVPTEMWIDDGNNYYGLKAKVNTNVTSQTFSVTSADELYYGVKVTVTEGKILTNAATAPGTKIKTDSIYFKAKFTGDPATYVYKGYKRTQFSQDDH